MPPPGLRRAGSVAGAGAATAVLAAATAVVVTTEFIVVGLLPGMARDLGVSVDRAGRLVTWFALSSALLGPLLTVAASRAQPRRALSLLLIPFAAGNLVMALAPGHALVALVRVVQGAALPPFVSIASTAAARLAGTAGENRALARINLGAIAAIVLIVPAGVAVADRAGRPAVFLALAALSIAAALAAAAATPRIEPRGPASIAAQAAILRRPALHVHLLLSAVLFAAMFAPYTYLVALLETVAGLDGQGVAIALAAFGAAGLAGNWIAGRVVDRGPALSTAVAALALGIAIAAASRLAASPPLLAPLLVVWGAAHAAAFLICQVRVMNAGPGAPALALSLNISACNAGIAAGAAAGGAVVAHSGVVAAGMAGAALAAVAVVMALLIACAGPHRE